MSWFTLERGGVTLRGRVQGAGLPDPARLRIAPDIWSSRSARFTVSREAPNCLTRADSLGRRSPAEGSPATICCCRLSKIRRYFGVFRSSPTA